MSETADERSGPPASELQSSPSRPPADADGAGTPKKRRRRGSRGGRGRRRPGADGATSTANGSPVPGAAADRRPDDLPDRPIEGRPTGAAAEAATVPLHSDDSDGAGPAPSRRRRRRGGRGRGAAA